MKSPAGQDLWSFLPLYDFCVLYLPSGADRDQHRPGDWMLAVRVSADSGYKRSGKSEPDARDFADVGGCETVVYLYVYYCTKNFQANWQDGIYDANVWPADDGEGSFGDGRVRTFTKKIPLHYLLDSESVRREADVFRAILQRAFPKTNW